LSLSTDDNEANKTRIAYHNGWNLPEEWNKFPTQKSAAISLVAGQNYYIEALMNEGIGGDNLAVGWRKPSDGNGTVPAEVLPCTAFDYFDGPPVVNVTGVTLNSSSETLVVGSSTTLLATVAPVDADDQTVVWASSDPNIATVDATGLVSAIAEGNASISVTTNDGNFSAQTNIAVTSDTTNDCIASGSILMERYDNINGYTIADLLNASIFPDAPTSMSELTDFEIPENTGDNYGVRVRGLLCAPETGTYYFYVSGNNYSELSLSTSSAAADKIRIAYHEDWTSNKEWDKFSTQKSQPVQLQQGNAYYIEALMKEGAFGDNLAAGWRKPSDGNGAVAVGVIPGSVLSPIAIENVAVDGVAIAPTNITLMVDEETTLNATVSPFNASDKSIVWSSNNPAIATVDTNGMVTAVGEGNTVVVATTNDGAFTAQSTIEVILGEAEPCTASGTILMERYDNIAGYTITDLLNAPSYPDNPSSVAELTSFTIEENTGDDYGVRVRGHLCAPETGTYYFYVSGNNYSELNLSTSAQASDKIRVAYHESWTNNAEWDKFASQKSQGIFLRKGDKYYIEGLMKEGAFGDHLAAGWRKPSDGNGDSAAEVIPGNVLSPYMSTAELTQFLVWNVDNENLSNPNFGFSPNPVSSQLSVSVSNMQEDAEIEYAIYTVLGREVMRVKGGINETIDVSSFANGTYVIVYCFKLKR